MDAWFVVDMLIALCTAVPLKNGGLEKDKKAIRDNFFRNRFFVFYAPAVALYIADVANLPIWVWWQQQSLFLNQSQPARSSTKSCRAGLLPI
jgi:hypothetical protein